MDLGLVLRAAATPIVGVAVIAVLSGDMQPANGSWRSRFADAEDPALVIHGKQIYVAQCASCHGRFLQGQPLWRTDDEDRPRRAPALNETGPDWMHSDEELFATVADGHLPSLAQNPSSRMPAFRDLLAHNDILAVLAFIKARWPVSLRVAQAALNPGGAGRPQSLPNDWRFPLICMPGGTLGNQASINSPSADPR